MGCHDLCPSIHQRISSDKYKWIVWAVSAWAFLIVFFHRYALGVIADRLSAEMVLTGTQLSHLVSMYFYVYALLQIPNGILADTIGPRKMMTVGMFLSGIGTLIFASSTVLIFMYLGRSLVGLGVSGILICSLKLQTRWFKPREFATVLGLTAVMGNIGGILATTPFALLVTEIGWRPSFWIIGMMSLLMAALLWVIVRDEPEELGYPAVSVELLDDTQVNIREGIRTVLKRRNTWVIMLILGGIIGTVNSFSSIWGVPYLLHVYGMTTDAAASYIMIFTIGVMVGAPIMGKIADLLGNRKLVIQMGALVFSSIWVYKVFLMNTFPPQAQLPGLYFVAGFFGIFMMVSLAIIKESIPGKYAGTAISVINVSPFLWTILFNSLVGWILDKTWTGIMVNGGRVYELASYQYAFLPYVCLSLVALGLSFFLE